MKKYLPINLVWLGLLFISPSLHAQDAVLPAGEIFGAMSARQIGPALMSGRISDMEGHPTNSKIIYAGTAGGGVWKSSNGGATFSSIFDDYCQSIGVVRLDPHDPDNTIYVGTGEVWTRNSTSIGDGLFKSTDGGGNWEKLPYENSERISSVIIHPEDQNTIYVGELGALWGDSDNRGVYKSTDGGTSWENILNIDATTGCSDLIMDPKDPNTLYAAFWEFRRTAWSFSSGGHQSALYKSTDGGKNWNKIHNGFPAGQLGRIAVAVAPSDANVVYAVIESEKDEDKGLYRSDNKGESWTKLNGNFELVVRPFYFSRINVDPKDPDVLVKSGLQGSISRDGGKTFTPPGNMHSDIHDVWYDVNNSEIMYWATDGGVYRSWDGGQTLDIVTTLPVSQFYHITMDNAEPYNVYGGLQDNGSWYGPSSSPGGVEARDWESVGAGDGFRVLKHNSKPIVYSEMQGAENVWRFDTERRYTKTVQPLPESEDEDLRFNWNAPIALSPHNDDRLYIGSQYVHVSDDMGATWRKISGDLTTNDPAKLDQENSGGLSKDNSGAENHCTVFTIMESPVNERVIWAGTDDGNVQVTRDGGRNWTNVTTNITGLPSNTWCYHIEASVHGAGTAYAVFDGHTKNDKNAYAYKTTDYGQSWTSITTDNIHGFTRSIQEDLVNENLLFLGTEFGLYITLDGGMSWSKFTNNMPAVAVHHVEMHPTTNDIVMGTHGRGVIIIDDVSPLRELTPEIADKELHFFDVEPFVLNEQSGFGSSTTDLSFVGSNAPNNVRLPYYLKKRHIFGKMYAEIQDMDGNTITDVNVSKSKGINELTWDFNRPFPTMAKGKSFTFGGFTAPRVPAGTYKVVMNKGKKVFEKEFEVIYDDKSPISLADRQQQQQMTDKLYDMSEHLAYKVYQVDEMVTFAESLTDNASLNGKAETVSSKLTALKETLVITTGDNYVGTVDPELREKLATIYSKIAGSFNAPSTSELATVSAVTQRYDKAMSDLDKIVNKDWKALKAAIEKAGLELPDMKNKEEFLGR